ncbi:MAG: hypothetical protein AABX05_04890, partial [Nanoarchaeota archaeon]
MASSGDIYLNDDDYGDLELAISPDGRFLTVENLNFIEPSVADVSVYDSNFNVIGGDIIEAGLG